jgi:hypothetical protein
VQKFSFEEVLLGLICSLIFVNRFRPDHNHNTPPKCTVTNAHTLRGSTYISSRAQNITQPPVTVYYRGNEYILPINDNSWFDVAECSCQCRKKTFDGSVFDVVIITRSTSVSATTQTATIPFYGHNTRNSNNDTDNNPLETFIDTGQTIV